MHHVDWLAQTMVVLSYIYVVIFICLMPVFFLDDLKERKPWHPIIGVVARCILAWLMLANLLPAARRMPHEIGYFLFLLAVLWHIVEFWRDGKTIDSDSELEDESKKFIKWLSFVAAIAFLLPAFYLALKGIFKLQ
jgi:hypothetical protein